MFVNSRFYIDPWLWRVNRIELVTRGYPATAAHPESTEADQEPSTNASQGETVQRVNTMLSNLNEGVSRTGRTNIHFVKEILIQVIMPFSFLTFCVALMA